MLGNSAPFGLRVRRRPRLLVIELRGELDILAAERLAPRLVGLARDGHGDVVLDLRAVTFLDCAGVSLLCRVREETMRRQAGLTLVIDNPFFQRILRLVGLGEAFDVISDPGIRDISA